MEGNGIVGVIANPFAGKDIRRLIAHASPTSDGAKIGIIRRVVAGAIEGGAKHILLIPDTHRLGERAVDRLDTADVKIEVLDMALEGARTDSTRAARMMCERNVGAVVVLGGDGTHRDVAKGWPNAPMVAISTGTNNVFPRNVDATVAGLAAGLVASGHVPLVGVSDVSDVIHATLPGEQEDLALVDVGVVNGSFAGSRAVWNTTELLAVISCVSEPDTVGLASVGARMFPGSRTDRGGVVVWCDRGESAVGDQKFVVRAPVTPGVFVDVRVQSASPLPEGETVTVNGPCVLSFDGERDVVLAEGESAEFCIRRDGPLVIDPSRALRVAAEMRHFVSGPTKQNATKHLGSSRGR